MSSFSSSSIHDSYDSSDESLGSRSSTFSRPPSPPPHVPSLSPSEVRETQLLFQGRVVREVPVLDIVREAWRFQPSAICLRPFSSPPITISHVLLQAYGDAIAPAVYVKAFLDIILSIHKQLALAKGRFPFGYFKQHTKAGVREPEIVFGTQKKDTWNTMGAWVHVSKEIYHDYALEEDICLDVDEFKELGLYDNVEHHVQRVRRVNFVVDASIATQIPRLPPSSRLLDKAEIIPAMHTKSMLTHGIRVFATGMAVQETTVTVYYGDHSGLMKSASFDFIDEPELLVLVVAALSNAHERALGFHPCIRLGIDTVTASLATSTLHFNAAYELDGNLSKKWNWEVKQVRGKPLQLFNHQHVLGKRTNVVPIRMAAVRNNVVNPLYTGNTGLVMKTYWPKEKHVSEDHVHRVLYAKLRNKPHVRQHIASLVCSVKASMGQLGLPRAFLGDVEGADCRMFCCMVMTAYRPLASLKTAADFKIVFLNAVRAHHSLWEDAGYLHRDISTGNIMYLEEEGRIRGVLTDFDLARPREDIERDIKFDEYELLSESRMVYVGTRPFVALELLADMSHVQTYRHDLESFFYLLCWHIAAHNPEIAAYDEPIEDWRDEDTLHCISEKGVFLYCRDEKEAIDTVFSRSYEEYDGIIEEWVKPLLRLFRRVGHKLRWEYGLREQEELEDETEEEAAELPNVDFAMFMAAIGENVNWPAA
ncbi:hypothetical protein EUX98_g2711 [Antrodiella citrinella]|uniref:Protein kinase domain-containing protein n=1 Tax=Antrodiella citrinella TaxID=2447956 RepID=A0A4V3XJ31_9APHY|nr:hypothetical protein EUX98_g2711 [Antrodiella citrinella]